MTLTLIPSQDIGKRASETSDTFGKNTVQGGWQVSVRICNEPQAQNQWNRYRIPSSQPPMGRQKHTSPERRTGPAYSLTTRMVKKGKVEDAEQKSLSKEDPEKREFNLLPRSYNRGQNMLPHEQPSWSKHNSCHRRNNQQNYLLWHGRKKG